MALPSPRRSVRRQFRVSRAGPPGPLCGPLTHGPDRAASTSPRRFRPAWHRHPGLGDRERRLGTGPGPAHRASTSTRLHARLPVGYGLCAARPVGPTVGTARPAPSPIAMYLRSIAGPVQGVWPGAHSAAGRSGFGWSPCPAPSRVRCAGTARPFFARDGREVRGQDDVEVEEA